MDLVPVVGAGHRHIGNGEVFVQYIKRRGIAAPAAGNNRGADFEVLGERRTVKQSVHEGDNGAIGRAVVNRTAHHKPVRLFEFGGCLIDDIVEYAFFVFRAGSAGDAAADVFVSDVDQFGFNAFGFKNADHFLKRAGGAAVWFRTAVDQ